MKKANKKQQCNTKKAKSKLNSTKTRTFKKRLLYNSELTNFDFSTYYLVGAEVYLEVGFCPLFQLYLSFVMHGIFVTWTLDTAKMCSLIYKLVYNCVIFKNIFIR